MQYLHCSAGLFIKDISILLRDYDGKRSVAKRKFWSSASIGLTPRRMVGGKPPVVK
jgi:hypothetical protein